MNKNRYEPTLADSMTHLKIKKGLTIPLEGESQGEVQTLSRPPLFFLDFDPFALIHPHLLVKEGDLVKTGEPLIQDKKCEKRVWISPGSGKVKEIFRGEKRRLLGISIEAIGKEQEFEHPPLSSNATREQIAEYLSSTGLLSHIFMRPFHTLAHPHLLPKAIFVKALESAPFTPPSEMQVQGHEENFQAGLDLLAKLSKVYLAFRLNSLFSTARNVEVLTIEGPHPSSHPSLHIQAVDPIRKLTDVVWTIDVCGVVAIGKRLRENRTHSERIVALAGGAFLPEHRRYVRTSVGVPLDFLAQRKTANGSQRLISGDPLMGKEMPFLGFFHSVCTALPIENKRKILSFFRLGGKGYTATRAYALPFRKKVFPFSTELHGEVRPFIDPNVYDAVMPLKVPTVPLIKAILAEDFDRAIALGLLEVAPEDFALPTFVCPSKIEMVEIVEQGLRRCASEMLALG